jgi:hypothetical protein
MKRFVIPFVIAIIAGVSVASAATLLRAKPAPVVAPPKHDASDSTPVRVIDSAGVVVTPTAVPADSATQHGDSTKKAAAIPGSVASALANATASHGPLPLPLPIAPTLKATSATAPAATEIAPADRRISRVMAAMPPRDAAKVLTQLADHDIAIILGNLTEKQEAAILAQLPVDRLAAVSKLALRPTPRVK